MTVYTLDICSTDSAHFTAGLYVEAADDSPVLTGWIEDGLARLTAMPLPDGAVALGLDGQPVTDLQEKPKRRRKSRKKANDG